MGETPGNLRAKDRITERLDRNAKQQYGIDFYCFIGFLLITLISLSAGNAQLPDPYSFSITFFSMTLWMDRSEVPALL